MLRGCFSESILSDTEQIPFPQFVLGARTPKGGSASLETGFEEFL
jgi:hypothetical protein